MFQRKIRTGARHFEKFETLLINRLRYLGDKGMQIANSRYLKVSGVALFVSAGLGATFIPPDVAHAALVQIGNYQLGESGSGGDGGESLRSVDRFY